MTTNSIYIKSESTYRSERIRQGVVRRRQRTALPFVRRPAEKSELGR